MKIELKVESPAGIASEAVIVGLFEEAPRRQINRIFGSNTIKGLARAMEGFKGRLNQLSFLPTYGQLPSKNILFVGLGKLTEFSQERARQTAGSATKFLQDRGVGSFAMSIFNIDKEHSAFAKSQTEGAILSAYKFNIYKSPETIDDQKKLNGFTILLSKESQRKDVALSVRQAQIISDAVNFARDLVNSPANVVTPSYLADTAKKIARTFKLRCKILSAQALKRLGMRGILSVSQGSNQPPKFIILEYRPLNSGKATIVLAGKGITFDAGGISLKPFEKLDRMKYDKAGAGAVFGIMRACAKLRLPFHLIGLVAACENLPSGSAYKPGDIIRLASGKTVEIVNTDAEGRLIMSDALWFAKRYKPDAIIDLATLTGACRVALGDVAIGMLGNDRRLMDRVRNAGEKSYERVWELPLWNEYKDKTKSDIADIKNVVEGGGGAITAAAFLSKFTDGFHWVHLDIAGTAWMEESLIYKPKGATGVGVRLIIQMLLDWEDN